MKQMLSRVVVFAALIMALALVGTASAGENQYDRYACTIQGTPGLTYIVEGSRYGGLTTFCRAWKRSLHQRQLRWGLHAPSFSSGESPKATWVSRKLELKLTLLAVQVPATKQLVRIVNGLLSPSIWRRVSTSNYP